MMELATSMIRSGDSGCFGAIRPDWLAAGLGTQPSSLSYLHRVFRPSLQRSLGECTDQSTNGRHKSTVGTPSPDPALLVARLIPTPRPADTEPLGPYRRGCSQGLPSTRPTSRDVSLGAPEAGIEIRPWIRHPDLAHRL